MPASRWWSLTLLLICLAVSASAAATDDKVQVLRWAEDRQGCAFQAGEDGTYRYALATDDFVVTVAMDAQELDKARRRIEPMLGLFVSVRFLRQNRPQFVPGKITLAFLKHFQQKEAPWDSALLVAHLQANEEKEDQAAARNIHRHPEKKADIEAVLKQQQQSTAEIIEWVRTKTLKVTTARDDEVAGWLLFPARTRWIGELNHQEQFLLRIPLGQVVVEFPFTLPPSQGDIRLRTRPSD
jgi:hypothetical protein